MGSLIWTVNIKNHSFFVIFTAQKNKFYHRLFFKFWFCKKKMLQTIIIFSPLFYLCAGAPQDMEEYELVSPEDAWNESAMEMWKGMDLDKNEKVTRNEFEKYWRQAHTSKEMDILRQMFPIVDDNQNGWLEFDEVLNNGKRVIIKSGLLGMMWYLLKNAKTEEELAEMTINATKLRRDWEEKFLYFTIPEIKQIIQELDLNEDGKIHHIELLIQIRKLK